MSRLYIKNLCIEVTRRCNMACTHCMRGDAQDIDIDHRHIWSVLRHVKYIQHLTIGGGEPSLNVKTIRYILKLVRLMGIHIYEFYIVTNGSDSSSSQEFIDVCSELYDYQENQDTEENHRMLEMSDDKYHNKQFHSQTITKLSRYPFFGLRRQSENIVLFKEGRCSEGFENHIHPIYLTAEDYVYGVVYLNAMGEILSNCDLSYEHQKTNKLCSSGCIASYLKQTLKERIKDEKRI